VGVLPNMTLAGHDSAIHSIVGFDRTFRKVKYILSDSNIIGAVNPTYEKSYTWNLP
jgi:hypothetical protein